MAGPCRVCDHTERPDVDAAIVSGLSDPKVAKQFGISKDSVRRHRISHLSPALQALAVEREKEGARTALDRMEALYEKASAVLEAANADGKPSLSLAAIRELRGIVELLAKLNGELDDRPTVQVLNVTASPEWDALRGVVLTALRPYPEAGRAVALALEAGHE